MMESQFFQDSILPSFQFVNRTKIQNYAIAQRFLQFCARTLLSQNAIS